MSAEQVCYVAVYTRPVAVILRSCLPCGYAVEGLAGELVTVISSHVTFT